MTKIDLCNLNAYDLPKGATLRRIAGNWIDEGYINNLNRPSCLDVVVIGEAVYLVGQYGYLKDAEFEDVRPIMLDEDSNIPLGGGWTFSASGSELARVGLVASVDA